METHFLFVEDVLKDSTFANAETIVNILIRKLDHYGLQLQKLSTIAFNGAAVVVGKFTKADGPLLESSTWNQVCQSVRQSQENCWQKAEKSVSNKMAFFSCCYLWHFHWLPCSSTDTETAQGWRRCSIWSPQQSQHRKIPWSHLHLKCSPTHPLLLRQDLRNRLSIEMLQALLAITINGPKVGTPECVCQLTHMSELAFNCIRLQFMLHHAQMQVIFVNQILWFNQLICFPKWRKLHLR